MKWLSLLMLLPLAGAAIISALPKSNEKAAKQAALRNNTCCNGSNHRNGGWLPTRQYQICSLLKATHGFQALELTSRLGVDAIALVLILMSTILAPIVVLAGWDEAHGGRWSVKTFYILILVLETMMIGVFAATDLFLFYVIFEAMLIPVYFLIGGYGTGERAAAAVKFLLYSLFGGLMMLASIIALYVMSGDQGGHTFDIDKLSQLQMSSTTQNLLFLGFFIAFAIKAPLWPFHTWLPDAAKSATPGTSVLLLGVLDKVGTFGMIRYCLTLFPEASKTFTPLIMVLGGYFNSLWCLLSNWCKRY
jgi:NADH-quinone oxidoreductase subunit M